MKRWIAALAALAGAVPAPAATPPSEAADTVFGIRLGVPLAGQMPECPGDGRLDDGPCRARDPMFGGYTARVSRAVFAELGPVSVRRLREVDGVVVEVEADFPASQSSRVERYLRRTRGTPTESERYERGSRVFGLRKLMFHTWRAAGTTLHFDEQSASDMGLVRAHLDTWAATQR